MQNTDPDIYIHKHIKYTSIKIQVYQRKLVGVGGQGCGAYALQI